MNDKPLDYRLHGHEPILGQAFYGGPLSDILKRAAKFIKKNEIDDVLEIALSRDEDGEPGLIVLYGTFSLARSQ